MLIKRINQDQDSIVIEDRLNDFEFRIRGYKRWWETQPSTLELERYLHDNVSPVLVSLYPNRITPHESYRVCSCKAAEQIRERMNKEPMDEEIRISGPFANMKEEDFRTIFNTHVGVVKKMDNETLLLHRQKLQAAIKRLRICDLAANETENERIADMDKNEREEYRKKSAAYKPKPPVEDEPRERKARSTSTPVDKAVKALMTALGMTEEEAKDFISKKKNGGN